VVGKREFEYYFKEKMHLVCEILSHTAKKKLLGLINYNPTRDDTQGKEFFSFGRVDIRAKFSKRKGFCLPALWMRWNKLSEEVAKARRQFVIWREWS